MKRRRRMQRRKRSKSCRIKGIVVGNKEEREDREK